MSSKNTRLFSGYGDALKEVLLRRDLEQKWLAEKLDTGQDQISRYITNKVKPGTRRRRRINDLLGVEITQNKGGDWKILENKAVKDAYQSAEQVEERLNSYKDEKPSLDEIAQDLRDAKRAIEHSLSRIDDIRGQS